LTAGVKCRPAVGAAAATRRAVTLGVVFGARVARLARDVGGQRDLAGALGHVEHAEAARGVEGDAGLPGVGAALADGGRVVAGKAEARAGGELLGGLEQAPPLGGLAGDGVQEQALDGAAAGAPAPKTRLEDGRGIAEQARARGQDVRQLGEGAVFGGARGTGDHHQPRGIAPAGGGLRDAFGRQRVIEQGGIHVGCEPKRPGDIGTTKKTFAPEARTGSSIS